MNSTSDAQSIFTIKSPPVSEAGRHLRAASKQVRVLLVRVYRIASPIQFPFLAAFLAAFLIDFLVPEHHFTLLMKLIREYDEGSLVRDCGRDGLETLQVRDVAERRPEFLSRGGKPGRQPD